MLIKKPRLRLHTHPHMERAYNIPEDHVIIDADVYLALIQEFGPYFQSKVYFIEDTSKQDNKDKN